MNQIAGESTSKWSTSDFIPLSVPTLNGREKVYIDECLESNWVSSAGRFVTKFGQACAEIAGTRFGIPVVNGTAALHLSVILADIKPEEEVVIPALTFIATASGVRHAGAWPAILDVDPATWQLDPERLRDFVRKGCERKADGLYNRSTRRKVTGIMPVHLLGHPSDMDPIVEIAEEYNLSVIEDAAEAVGAEYKGRPVGGIGRLGCFSFNGNKTFTCGGGGAIVTNDERVAERAEYLSTQAKDDNILFVHKALGYNYRLTNIQAAMGLAQLEFRSQYLARKKAINLRYRQAFGGIRGVTISDSAPWAESAMWLTTVRINAELAGISNLQMMRALAAATQGGTRIETRLLWQPMHRSEALASCYRTDAPAADAIYEEALSLPSSVGLTELQQDSVIGAMKRLLDGS